MALVSFYPPTNDGRGHWWQVIEDNATPVLTSIGYTTAQIAPILVDATWGVFCYITVRHYFDNVSKALTAYANTVLDGTNGAALPPLPAFPAAPELPVGGTCGVEERRILWVQEIKNNPRCTPPVAAMLGIETPTTPFNPGIYMCNLYDLHSTSAHTVSGKFRKAGGHVDGINLYGRKPGTAAWVLMGRFNATPFSASVPMTGTAPEEWEFYAMAVKRDVEFGLASAISPVIVRA